MPGQGSCAAGRKRKELFVGAFRQQIGDTPLSVSVYSVEKAPTKINENGTLEIIFCLKGSVRFSYAYEEFTLHAGEYISVDRDAYYLYDGKDNMCVSFYFDLTRYEDKYPFIRNNLFVCEGFAESDMPFPTAEHQQLKGMLIAMLRFISEKNENSRSNEKGGSSENGGFAKIEETTGRIVDLFINHFDIFFFHAGELPGRDNTDTLERLHEVNDYMYKHMKEKITVGDLAAHMNFTEGYMSEYLRKISVGFRSMLSYIRASISERLLLQTDKTILEISEEVGFSDVKYYYSAFRKWYNCTPRQFREQYGRASEEKLVYYRLSDISGLIDETMKTHYMETYMG